MDQHLEANKLLFKQAVDNFLISNSDDDYEKCQYAKRQLCKCQQMITNIKNKRLEELKKNLNDVIIKEVFGVEQVIEPVVEPVAEPVSEPVAEQPIE